ncbi:MAG: hypothetical protein ABEJ03_00790 [Candidatus Nanohaloarchaea archaeon]
MADAKLSFNGTAVPNKTVSGSDVRMKLVREEGPAEITNYLEDDWGDNSLTSRSNTKDDLFAHPDAN